MVSNRQEIDIAVLTTEVGYIKDKIDYVSEQIDSLQAFRHQSIGWAAAIAFVVSIGVQMFLPLQAQSAVTSTRAVELAKEQGIEITIRKDKEINAYCDRLGRISFTQGILDDKKFTEDHFMFVLYHEASHAAFKHVDQRVTLVDALQNIIDYINKEAHIPKAFQDEMDAALNLVILAQSRMNELEADSRAYGILKTKGFKADKVCTVFDEVMGAESDGKDEEDFTSTHPAGNVRERECRTTLGN